MNRAIVVATDGRAEAAGALRVAQALAQRDGRPVVVLSVLEPLALYGALSPDVASDDRAEAEAGSRGALRARVEAQLAAVAGGPAAGWEVHQGVGRTAPTIASFAHEQHAALIVLGHAPRHGVERWVAGETAVRVMQMAHVPVLAVPPEAQALPRRALVAVDFSEFSRQAALWALGLLEPDGELHLAHALSLPVDPLSGALGSDWLAATRASAHKQLDELCAALRGSRRVHVQPHLRLGDAAATLLDLADELGIELLAAGSHGRGFFGRLLLGSTSTRLARAARCAVLVVPPPTLPEELRQVPRDEYEPPAAEPPSDEAVGNYPPSHEPLRR
mgnify:CR=1 FL=1